MLRIENIKIFEDLSEQELFRIAPALSVIERGTVKTDAAWFRTQRVPDRGRKTECP